MKNKIVRTEEFEGGCHPLETISVAKQDLINFFADDFNLIDDKDIFIDGDARFADFDQPTIKALWDNQDEAYVFYLFKTGLTQKAVDVLLIDGFIK